MKRIFIIMFMFGMVSCKNDKKKVEIIKENKIELSSNERSILDLEYLNDDLEIAITEFKVIDNLNNNYEIEITMNTALVEKYSNNYMFFVHCYYYEGEEEEEGKKYIAIGTNRKKVLSNKIIFSRKFSTDVFDFKIIRYGLLNIKTKERYFNLKLDSINLSN